MRVVRDSCTQQVIKQSNKSSLTNEILAGVREDDAVVNQALYIAQISLFTYLKEVHVQYEQLEALSDQA